MPVYHRRGGRCCYFDEGSEIGQPIDVAHLIRVGHIVPARAVRELVPQVGQRDVGAGALDQSVNPVLSRPAAFRAFQPEHVQLGCGLAEGGGAVGHGSVPPFLFSDQPDQL